MTDEQAKAGFQGSETSTSEVVFHRQGNDPVLVAIPGTTSKTTGRYRRDQDHTLTSVQTGKRMGQAGTFTVQVKPSGAVASNPELDPLGDILDDDWIDIVMRRHDRVWHVMRGLVDDVRRSISVGGDGATSTVYTITGRDFQKVFEQTPLWFNKHNQENVDGALSLKAFTGLPTITGDPAEAVQGFLIGFLQQLQTLGRANWVPPSSLENILNNSFIETIQRDFQLEGFTGIPARLGINPNLAMPNGSAWALAHEWSDPAFQELFCDLIVDGQQARPDQEAPISSTGMGVFFRDKPFPTVEILDEQGNPTSGIQTGKNSPWFSLPMFTVPRQQILESDVGRTGLERLNSFNVGPQIVQEMSGSTIELSAPLWNREDIKHHGLRRYDISSHYKTQGASLLSLSVIQRYLVRDWYMMNPYLWNGTLSLAVGRPDIRIGSRVRIPGASTKEDETYYVEEVNHQWMFGPGIKTTLGVTRGYRGTDEALLLAMRDMASNYQVPDFAPPLPALTEIPP